MNIIYIKFFKSLDQVMQMILGIQPQFGKVYLNRSPFQEYTVNLKVCGQIHGMLNLVIDKNTTKDLYQKCWG